MIYADNNTKDIFMYNVYSTVWDCRIFPKVILNTGPLFCNLLHITRRKMRNAASKISLHTYDLKICLYFHFFETTFPPSPHSVVHPSSLENSRGFYSRGTAQATSRAFSFSAKASTRHF